jgi:hypothetical protein
LRHHRLHGFHQQHHLHHRSLALHRGDERGVAVHQEGPQDHGRAAGGPDGNPLALGVGGDQSILHRGIGLENGLQK